jgi:twitching motility two-component system response regulator PilG
MALILVADDNASLRLAMECCLPSMGFRVALAEDARRALELIAAEPPDLIMLDVDMPEVDGITFCTALKSDPLRSHIPIVIMTGRANPEIRRRALAAGAIFLLEKPFTFEAVQSIFERHLPAGV